MPFGGTAPGGQCGEVIGEGFVVKRAGAPFLQPCHGFAARHAVVHEDEPRDQR